MHVEHTSPVGPVANTCTTYRCKSVPPRSTGSPHTTASMPPVRYASSTPRGAEGGVPRVVDTMSKGEGAESKRELDTTVMKVYEVKARSPDTTAGTSSVCPLSSSRSTRRDVIVSAAPPWLGGSTNARDSSSSPPVDRARVGLRGLPGGDTSPSSRIRTVALVSDTSSVMAAPLLTLVTRSVNSSLNSWAQAKPHVRFHAERTAC